MSENRISGNFEDLLNDNMEQVFMQGFEKMPALMNATLFSGTPVVRVSLWKRPWDWVETFRWRLADGLESFGVKLLRWIRP
jgi:hypothetical protein